MKNYKEEKLQVDDMEGLPEPAILAGAGVLKYIDKMRDFCKQVRERSNLS